MSSALSGGGGCGELICCTYFAAPQYSPTFPLQGTSHSASGSLDAEGATVVPQWHYCEIISRGIPREYGGSHTCSPNSSPAYVLFLSLHAPTQSSTVIPVLLAKEKPERASSV